MNSALEKAKSIIKISRVKGIIGCVLALAVFLICAIFYSWAAGAVFAVAFAVAGIVKLSFKNKTLVYLCNVLYTAVCIFIIYYVSLELILPEKFPCYQTALNISLNLLCVAIVCGIFLIITNNIKVSVSIAGGVLAVFSIVNYFVYVFRDREFTPIDLLTTGTVLNVMDQYKLVVPAYQFYLLVLCLIFIFAQYSLPKWPELPKIKARLWMLLVEFVMICVLCFSSTNIRFMAWRNEPSMYNGFYLNFFLGIRASMMEQPDNYSAEMVEKISKEYNQPEENGDLQRPNVVVVMNESFADFNVFGSGVSTDKPITPFIDSLKENTIRGYALSSVYGGNTANSEFEFLTGHSMGFLPTICVPYQQYIRNSTATIIHNAQKAGYATLGTHPYYGDGWLRTTVYPKLGFERSTFIESYPQKNMVREYVSDRETYDYILNELNNKKQDKPLFLFGITMQNHGNYNYEGEDFTNTITLKGYDGNYPLAEQYLSLINETDKATEYFINTLEEFNEDTVVLFFGDHMPKLENEFYEELAGGPLDTLDKQMLQYTVPFFIWANYDIPEAEVELTSLNFLSRHLLDAARIDLPPYYQFLAEVEQEIPAINARGYYSKSQKKFLTFDEAEGREKEWLDKYEAVQYNNLFDTKNRNENFFAKYISENS